MNALTIKQLSFSYNDTIKAIDNISLEIECGTYVSLLGHNGSGKSTLAKLIVGLLPFSDGQIIVDGLNADETIVLSGGQKLRSGQQIKTVQTEVQ